MPKMKRVVNTPFRIYIFRLFIEESCGQGRGEEFWITYKYLRRFKSLTTTEAVWQTIEEIGEEIAPKWLQDPNL